MFFQLFFFLSIHIVVLPVLLWLLKLNFHVLHLIDHLVNLLYVVVNQQKDFLFFSYVTLWVCSEQGTFLADPALALQTDRLLDLLVLWTDSKRLDLLFLLLLLYLFSATSESLREIRGHSIWWTHAGVAVIWVWETIIACTLLCLHNFGQQSFWLFRLRFNHRWGWHWDRTHHLVISSGLWHW